MTSVSRWRWSFLKHRPIRVSAAVNLSHPGRFKHTAWFEKTLGCARWAELLNLGWWWWWGGGGGGGEKSKTSDSLPLLQWWSLCLDVHKSYVRKKNETQVSKNRYSLFGDAEEQPPTDQQGDAETNAPVGGRKPASNQGNKLLFITNITSVSDRAIASYMLLVPLNVLFNSYLRVFMLT